MRYLSDLHASCPAARAYTFEMLWEDFRICSAMFQIAFATILGNIMVDMPEGTPNLELFRQAIPRYAKCYEQLDIVG